VVDEHMAIVVGHTRWAAAKRLGMTEVPVHVARGLTPAQIKAYRLMDNCSHENAEWDDALLKLELEDLKLEDLDLALTGFDEQEITRLLADGMMQQPTKRPSRRLTRSVALAISGSAVSTGCCTAMPPCWLMLRRCLDGELADMLFWADAKRRLSSEASAEPGQWRTSRAAYARAAAWIAGTDRWTEAMWRNLEQQVGAPDPLKHEEVGERPDTPSASIAGVLRRRPEQRSRRVFRSSYMI
jgi:hypothetical protein